MKTVTNKTQKPLTIPLPRGKTLHLGFGKTAAITANASEHPPLKKLVDAGQIEIHDEGSPSAEGAGGGEAGRAWMPGHGSRAGHRGGDRWAPDPGSSGRRLRLLLPPLPVHHQFGGKPSMVSWSSAGLGSWSIRPVQESGVTIPSNKGFNGDSRPVILDRHFESTRDPWAAQLDVAASVMHGVFDQVAE
jgi:hypothetical protein